MDREVIHELGLQGDWFESKDKDGSFSGFARSTSFSGFARSTASALSQSSNYYLKNCKTLAEPKKVITNRANFFSFELALCNHTSSITVVRFSCQSELACLGSEVDGILNPGSNTDESINEKATSKLGLSTLFLCSHLESPRVTL